MHLMNGYYPGAMPPPPYHRNGTVSSQSQQSSMPAYFTSSLPRSAADRARAGVALLVSAAVLYCLFCAAHAMFLINYTLFLKGV